MNTSFFKQLPRKIITWPARYWRRGPWHKVASVVVVILLLTLGTMYGIARWYIWSEHSKPLTLGATFVPDYAQSLGVDPKKTMDALITDLHNKQFR